MKRTLRIVLLTSLFFAGIFVFSPAFYDAAEAMNAGGSEQNSGCRVSPLQVRANESIFLEYSNSLVRATAGGRTFLGCWTYFSSGPCRGIFSDNKGNNFICGECDDFGNPGSGGCSRISSQTLANGYWCS